MSDIQSVEVLGGPGHGQCVEVAFEQGKVVVEGREYWLRDIEGDRYAVVVGAGWAVHEHRLACNIVREVDGMQLAPRDIDIAMASAARRFAAELFRAIAAAE